MIPGAWPARYLCGCVACVGGRMPQRLSLQEKAVARRSRERPCQEPGRHFNVGAWHACGWAHATAAHLRRERQSHVVRGKTPVPGPGRHGTCGCVACVWWAHATAAISAEEKAVLHSQERNADTRAWPARYLSWVRGMRVGGRMPQRHIEEKAVAHRSAKTPDARSLAGT
jgi:hypothetical protein